MINLQFSCEKIISQLAVDLDNTTVLDSISRYVACVTLLSTLKIHGDRYYSVIQWTLAVNCYIKYYQKSY